eukprot:2117301-Pyramimonas_sp.AAC.1
MGMSWRPLEPLGAVPKPSEAVSGASGSPPEPFWGRNRRSRQRPFSLSKVARTGEMTLGSSFASHISLSSARARCHCSPFPHALTPAL